MPTLRFVQSGALAGALLGLLEFVYLFKTVGDSFDGRGELLAAACGLIVLLSGVGALAGLIESLGERLLRSVPARHRALGTTLLCLPLIAAFCSQIFQGARARLVTGRHVYAVLIGALFSLALVGGIRLVRRLAGERWPRRWAAIFGLSLLAIIFYLADQRILPRLYPFFHIGLGVAAFAVLQSAIWLSGCAPRGRWASLLVLLGPVGLYGFHRHRPLRAITVERSQLAAPLLRAALPARRAPMGKAAATTAGIEETRPRSLGPRLEGADLVLITVDALRADRLTARVMPHLAALAEHGVVFEETYAQVPHTSFSVATLLTGKYVYSLSALGLDAASHQTLPEVLRRERYKTAAFFPPSVFYIDHDRLRALESSAYGFEYVKYEYLPAPERTDQVIDFLEREHPARAFVWVHYLEPHEPYDLHAGHLLTGTRTAPRDPGDEERYDSEVHFVDQEIARLIDYLQRTRPHAVVVLSADHGEEFGEHGGRYHGTTLYDEQVRVPLVFLSLDGRLPPRRIRGPVGLIDLAPTLLSLISIEPSARMRGRDLTPYLDATEDARPHGPVFGEIDRRKMVVTAEEKLLCDLESDSCQLFDRLKDPNEKHPLHDEVRLSTLRNRLDEWMAEELRFEAPSVDDAEGSKEERRAIERGRLGDRGAVPALAELLHRRSGRGGGLVKVALALLCTLPPEPETAPVLRALRTIPDPELGRLARIGLARLGDEGAKSELRRELKALCTRDQGQAELCARAALATSDVSALGEALDQVTDDQPLTVALIGALGHSHDPRARDPLLIALGRVRTRKETVEALTALGDPSILPFIERWIAWDPYIPVRVAMARLLGALGKSDPQALATLRTLAKVERDPPVMAAVLESLVQLGASEVHDLSRGDVLPAGKGELWLVGSGEGAVAVDGTATTAAMRDGVTRMFLVRRTRLRLHPAEGVVLKWAYLRDSAQESRIQER